MVAARVHGPGGPSSPNLGVRLTGWPTFSEPGGAIDHRAHPATMTDPPAAAARLTFPAFASGYLHMTGRDSAPRNQSRDRLPLTSRGEVKGQGADDGPRPSRLIAPADSVDRGGPRSAHRGAQPPNP